MHSEDDSTSCPVPNVVLSCVACILASNGDREPREILRRPDRRESAIRLPRNFKKNVEIQLARTTLVATSRENAFGDMLQSTCQSTNWSS